MVTKFYGTLESDCQECWQVLCRDGIKKGGLSVEKFRVLDYLSAALWIVAIILFAIGALVFLGTTTRSDYEGGGLINALAVGFPFLVAGFMFGVTAEIIVLFLRIEDHLDNIAQTQKGLLEKLSELAANPALLRSSETLSQSIETPDIPSIQTPEPVVVDGSQLMVTSDNAILYYSPSELSIKKKRLPKGTVLPLMGTHVEGWYSTRSGFVRASDCEVTLVEESALTPGPVFAPLESVVSSVNAAVHKHPASDSDFLGNVKQGRNIKLYGRDDKGAWVCGDLAGSKWIQTAHLSIQGNVFNLPVIKPPHA
jgi:hypothetical protein